MREGPRARGAAARDGRVAVRAIRRTDLLHQNMHPGSARAQRADSALLLLTCDYRKTSRFLFGNLFLPFRHAGVCCIATLFLAKFTTPWALPQGPHQRDVRAS